MRMSDENFKDHTGSTSPSHLARPLELFQALSDGGAVCQGVVALEDGGDVLRSLHRFEDARPSLGRVFIATTMTTSWLIVGCVFLLSSVVVAVVGGRGLDSGIMHDR